MSLEESTTEQSEMLASQIKRAINFHLRQMNKALEIDEDYDTMQIISASVSVRAFVHDTKNSTSILKKLEAKDKLQYVSTLPGNSGGEVVFFSGFGTTRIAPAGKWEIISDPQIYSIAAHFVEFEQWWSKEKIMVLNNKTSLTRRQLITQLANKSGAHIDNFDSFFEPFVTPNIFGEMIEVDNSSKKIPIYDSQVLPTAYMIIKELYRGLNYWNAKLNLWGQGE